MSTDYIPEVWSVKKDVIYAAITAVENGLAYARECLTNHEAALGRTTLSNKRLAEMMEQDIKQLEDTLKLLRGCGATVDVSTCQTGLRTMGAFHTDVSQINTWCGWKNVDKCMYPSAENRDGKWQDCCNDICPMRKNGWN
jgi:hypothetical protein